MTANHSVNMGAKDGVGAAPRCGTKKLACMQNLQSMLSTNSEHVAWAYLHVATVTTAAQATPNADHTHAMQGPQRTAPTWAGGSGAKADGLRNAGKINESWQH